MDPRVQSLARFFQSKGSGLANYAQDFVNAADRYGLDWRLLPAISGIETSFGKAGTGMAGPFGYASAKNWGNTRNAIEVAAKALGAQSNQPGLTAYYSRTRTIPEIARIWAPPGAANDAGGNSGWPSAVSTFFRQLGGDPSRQVRGLTGVQPMAPTTAPNGLTATGGGNLSAARGALMDFATESEKWALDPNRNMDDPALTAFTRAKAAVQSLGAGAPAPTSSGATGATSPQSGPVASLDGLGIGYGGVDSRLITRGGAGGNWGGSMERALAFLQAAKQFGYAPNTSGRWLSQKRSRQNTASGGISDHWQGSTNSYGLDLGVPNTAEGDRLMRQLAGWFGVNYTGGSWLNVNRDGYRYQIGWRTPGHFDHIHIGVKRL